MPPGSPAPGSASAPWTRGSMPPIPRPAPDVFTRLPPPASTWTAPRSVCPGCSMAPTTAMAPMSPAPWARPVMALACRAWPSMPRFTWATPTTTTVSSSAPAPIRGISRRSTVPWWMPVRGPSTTAGAASPRGSAIRPWATCARPTPSISSRTPGSTLPATWRAVA
ncbi:hypothetical protein D3C79_791180 [compost metagenome]